MNSTDPMGSTGGTDRTGSTATTPRAGDGQEPRMLGIYLNDHLAGATAGAGLARRLARVHRRSVPGDELKRLADEIERDRRTLLQIMETLRVPARRHKVWAGWAGEKAGRFKPNGRLLQRSGLSTMVELETLRLGVEGKALMWRALIDASAQDSRLDRDRLQELLERAREQKDALEPLRLRAACALFGPEMRPDGEAVAPAAG